MIAWPQNTIARELTNAEPVKDPSRDTAQASTPPVDLHEAAPKGDAAPPLPAPSTPLYLRRKTQAYSAGLLLALGASAMVHAAVVAYLGEHTARAGLEAETDATSVEIIIEAPPAQHLPGSTAAASQPQEPAAAPQSHAATPAEEPEPMHPTGAQENISAENPEEKQSPSNAEDASARESTEPVAPPAEETTGRKAESRKADNPEELSTPPDDSLPESTAAVILPTGDIPVPTPRPEPPKAATADASPRKQPPATPESPRKQAKAPAPGARKQAAAPAKPAAGKAEPTRQGAAASASVQQGGATAGEKAAYSRRLLRHVERHKRYPREAARQGVSGVAGLAITIDRQGRLAGARLSRSSGHAVLDEAALAVARRAAPYPRPPEGVGESTMTFNFTLRFER